jgi:hypothetical protein
LNRGQMRRAETARTSRRSRIQVLRRCHMG